MDGRVAVMMELEKALNEFKGVDLYSAGLDFFSALGYSVQPLKTAINESMLRFVYIINKNHCIFSRDETNAMENVANISWLFVLNHNTIWLRSNPREVRGNDRSILSINYFCVELLCDKRDRSILALIVTKIISKVINTAVVVLFKHGNQLLLSSALMMIQKNETNLKTYLSDWYVIDPIQEEVLNALSELCFWNLSNDSLYDLFIDWIQLMARPYFLNTGGYKYDCKSYSKLFFQQKGKDIFGNRLIDFCSGECDRLIETDPRDFYGYDYVSVEECIEVLEDNDDWIIMDMENVMEESAVAADDQIKQNLSTTIEHIRTSINCIDDEIFNDPIKLLNYLEKIEENK